MILSSNLKNPTAPQGAHNKCCEKADDVVAKSHHDARNGLDWVYETRRTLTVVLSARKTFMLQLHYNVRRGRRAQVCREVALAAAALFECGILPPGACLVFIDYSSTRIGYFCSHSLAIFLERVLSHIPRACRLYELTCALTSLNRPHQPIRICWVPVH